MNEPIVHWNILPEYLMIYLLKWAQDNPPIPFLRRVGTGKKYRPIYYLTEVGRADLEEWRARQN